MDRRVQDALEQQRKQKEKGVPQGREEAATIDALGEEGTSDEDVKASRTENKRIYDLQSEEARKIMANQMVQGYAHGFGYIERASYLELYVPVPKVRKDFCLRRAGA